MITIYKNPNGDTRTASKSVTFVEFQEANTSHIQDVNAVMEYISDLCLSAGEYHDCTKKTQEKMFYRDFKNTLETGASFTDGEWYQLHITAERHHIDNHCPEDVNLIDILEMIADRVCAGMARSGEVYDINLPAEILQKAVKNTTELLKEQIEVRTRRHTEVFYEKCSDDTTLTTPPLQTPPIQIGDVYPNPYDITTGTPLPSYDHTIGGTSTNGE